VVSKSVFIELGPVLTALVVGARVSSSFAAEIGTMRVTEQIDAMRALGTDPIQKLVTPRLIATAFTQPLLTVIADFVGIFGGFLVANLMMNITANQYWTTAWRALGYNDLVQGLLKPFLFAILVSLVGCFYGLRTRGGTQGVGLATTQAVVVASVWIFVVDLFVTRIFVNL